MTMRHEPRVSLLGAHIGDKFRMRDGRTYLFIEKAARGTENYKGANCGIEGSYHWFSPDGQSVLGRPEYDIVEVIPAEKPLQELVDDVLDELAAARAGKRTFDSLDYRYGVFYTIASDGTAWYTDGLQKCQWIQLPELPQP